MKCLDCGKGYYIEKEKKIPPIGIYTPLRYHLRPTREGFTHILAYELYITIYLIDFTIMTKRPFFNIQFIEHIENPFTFWTDCFNHSFPPCFSYT